MYIENFRYIQPCITKLPAVAVFMLASSNYMDTIVIMCTIFYLLSFKLVSTRVNCQVIPTLVCVCVLQGESEVGDWRGELVRAVGDVFAKEGEGLLTRARTQRATGQLQSDIADSLEQLIDEQVHGDTMLLNAWVASNAHSIGPVTNSMNYFTLAVGY